jgi:hypothetical protein
MIQGIIGEGIVLEIDQKKIEAEENIKKDIEVLVLIEIEIDLQKAKDVN